MEQDKKIPLSLYITGCMCAILIALSTLFKVMHWPFANPLVILGSVTFLFFYLPLWLIFSIKKGKRLAIAWYALVSFLWILTFLFKSVHWPFSGILMNIWISSSFFLVFPIAIIQLFLSRKKGLQVFHFIIAMFLLCSLVLSGVGGTASRLVGMANSFSKTTNKISSSIQKIETKKSAMYAVLDGLPDAKNSPFYKKAVRLKFISDSTLRYFRKFRNRIIALSERVPESVADTLTLDQMGNALNVDVTSEEIWGHDEYKPREGKYTGLELMGLINSYRDTVLQLASDDNRELIRAGTGLETKNMVNEHGDEVHWVAGTFRYTNTPMFQQVMENLRYQVLILENEVLNDLIASIRMNSAAAGSKFAEAGAQIDRKKTESEMKELKAYRELSEEYLAATYRYQDEQEKTIIAFIVGMVFCGVLVFYIIRSNILRKKLNKELEEQKKVIEEKQKEILDSIKYAKRIQQAHLPTDKYVEKKFNDMKK